MASRPTAKGMLAPLFASAAPVFALASALRIVLLLYGLWQDAHSPLKYTDVDYLVFTDAARFVARSHPDGPYARDTYRYTPLLAWMLLPTTWTPAGAHRLAAACFSSGKLLFALADLLAGWLIVELLSMRRRSGLAMPRATARRFATIWLLNPMVATISTRGSSEGLLAVMVVLLLWAVLSGRLTLAALTLGFSVHFKIYPFIYAPAIVWWMDNDTVAALQRPPPSSSPHSVQTDHPSSPPSSILAFFTAPRLKFALLSLAAFFGLNIAMYAIHGQPFLLHTYLHHFTRIDHRHNFSPYNILLYMTSAAGPDAPRLRIESLAFLPQLLLSCIFIPLVMAKKDLATTMLVQTWTFVTFNKVCTSQYFLWYMIFLPLYLPRSSFLRRPTLGFTALVLWVLAQAAWLQQGFQLEFLGQSTFVLGMWMSALGFFLVNCWILSVVVADSSSL